jgi:3-hydroxyisobutyrate dehydrogenase
VYDLSRAAAEPFLAKGAVWANSPKEVGAQSEMVFTSLPVPADVEQVALGPNGLIEGMRPDIAFFDMSANSVAMVRKINAAFAEKNLYMLDSPVSGGSGGAASGKMAIWSAATSSSSTATNRCSTRWATRPLISARSAPARSLSSSTTAPVP